VILGKLASKFGVCAPFSGACSDEQGAHFIAFSQKACASHFKVFVSFALGAYAVPFSKSDSAFHLVHVGAGVLAGRSY
jgi:hypothetical protein